MFVKQLAASAAGHEDIVVLVNAIKRNEPAAASSKQVTDH